MFLVWLTGWLWCAGTTSCRGGSGTRPGSSSPASSWSAGPSGTRTVRERKKQGEKESVCLYNVREIEMSSRVKEMKSDKWFRCCQLHLDPNCDGWIVKIEKIKQKERERE